MIRIVVTFLVAVQSLVPSGMCLCQFVPCEINTRSAQEASLAGSTAEPCCSCPARRAATRTADPSPAGDRDTSNCETLPEHPCPCPAPGEPWPGCPVVSAGPEARAAILPVPELVAPDTAAFFVAATDELTQLRAERSDPPIVPAAPIFLRHCAFLI